MVTIEVPENQAGNFLSRLHDILPVGGRILPREYSDSDDDDEVLPASKPAPPKKR
jgi:hypothetical protein